MTPSAAQSRRLVLIAVLALGVLAVYRGQNGYKDQTRPDGDTLFRRLWGTAVVGMGLALAADLAPSVAGPFAVLIVLGSLSNGGDRIIQTALAGIAPPPRGDFATPSAPGRFGGGEFTTGGH